MTTLGSRNFAVAGAKVCNSLPVDLRLLSRSLRTFGHKLKHLFVSEPWAHLRFFKVALYKFSHYYLLLLLLLLKYSNPVLSTSQFTVVCKCFQSVVESWWSLILPVVIVAVLVLVYDYYIDAACTAHLDATRTGQLGTLFILASALLLSAVWNHPFVEQVASMLDLSQLTSSEHQISLGVIVSALMFAVCKSLCFLTVLSYISPVHFYCVGKLFSKSWICLDKAQKERQDWAMWWEVDWLVCVMWEAST